MCINCRGYLCINILKGAELMTEVLMFILGFSAITSVYEIAKTSKSNKSNKVVRDAEKITKNLKM